MTIYEFNQLDELRQIEAFWTCGQYIGERTSKSSRYVLYHVNDFYVEVKYNIFGNAIKDIRSFDVQSPNLETYLYLIDIKEVLQRA